ncbi:hypothetical protein [Paenibacillus taiwanensis]|uniref:hypothetical protein n=1 Tax=Paenibacillus taiwanensis TaxID=401638 RepID=UPI000410DE17|nr:hypothetical protein [Paenibacillus taiwanensis]
MKKIAVLLLCACMLDSLGTGTAAQTNVVETTPDYVVSLDFQTIPHDALASGGHASPITGYELPIDMNARVEFVDPLLQ